MRTRATAILAVLVLGGCVGEPGLGDVQAGESNLTAAQRRARAGQIRDAAAANGITQGYLLAGIADAETNMSQCWSELTWACQGPYSSECGGPVVAGAGDGPCSLMQGGLGMFQFDSGTFTDTLASHGSGILTVAGNTAEAVEFVINMVIRSTHISGVSTRDEAIAWINGVRIGNGQWDAWITTVTHYYNGCAPGYSCFSSRYASYRDHTVNVHDEMGSSFWDTHTWAATYVHQSFPLAADPFSLVAGTEQSGTLEMRNTGTETWRVGHTFLGTTGPRDVSSPIAGSDWVSPNRAATVDHDVAPGDSGRFVFSVRAPATPGVYDQHFDLVEEGVTWFGDSGGPPDLQIEIRLTSTPAPAPTCPSGIGTAWSCQGTERVRCEAGVVSREPCASGCSAGACIDLVAVTPTPQVVSTFVGDGGVAFGDGGTTHGGGRPGAMISGGCSVGHGAGSGAPWLWSLALVPLLTRRRRRA